MKFKDYKYEHLAYEDIEKEYLEKLEKIKRDSDVDSFMEDFRDINRFRGHIHTMETICSVRHTIDTSDKYYDDEQTYWDETSPRIQTLENEFMRICVESPLRDKLPIPKTFMMIAENSLKSFDPKIIEELQEENRLSSAYGKLKASAKIEFEGEIYNLSSIQVKMLDPDRETRKKACLAFNGYYEEHEAEFDDIYDALVKVRDKMAKKLGYKNFVELGYLRMNRLDYDEKMVATYREQVVNDIVPMATKINERDAKRIGVDKLKCYDMDYEFKTGSPKPYAPIDDLVKDALKMYKEMSKETGEFFEMMVDCELFDLPTRPNKELGGYSTDFFDYKTPFIFSNGNGTSQDVNTLTHEAGHALQSYMSQKVIDIPDITFPTYESCEIHSMSMEFFTHPWMNLFFKEDTEKYYYSHIAEALKFLPYGCLVDHFQHEIYNHPEMTKEERKATWRELEKIYKPDSDYDGIEILEKGGWFYRQGHIFQSPFYYIDYTLAQVCALQFYVRTLKNDENAWRDYLHICELGGTKTFTEIVKEAGLISPFEKGCLSDVAKYMEIELGKIDDTNL